MIIIEDDYIFLSVSGFEPKNLNDMYINVNSQW